MLNILVLRKRKKNLNSIFPPSPYFALMGLGKLHLKLLRLENYMFKYIAIVQEMALMKAIVGENDSDKKTNKLNRGAVPI